MFSSFPYLEYLDERGVARSVKLKGDLFIVGSGPDCDLQIDDNNVSPEHIRLERTGDIWMARAVGFTEVLMDSIQFSVQTLTSGSTLQIDNVVELTFRDPDRDKQIAKLKKLESASSNVPEVDSGNNRNRLIPLMIFSVIMTLMIILYGTSRKEVVRDIDLRRNTSTSVAAAMHGDGQIKGKSVKSLSKCIEESALRFDQIGWTEKRRGTFWNYVKSVKEGQSTTDLENTEDFNSFVAEIENLYIVARDHEGRNQDQQAIRYYRQITQRIPDLLCPANIIATARLNILAQ